MVKTENIQVGTLVTMTCNGDKYGGRVSKIYTDKKIEVELISEDNIIWSRDIWTYRANKGWAKFKHSFKYYNQLVFGEAVNKQELIF